MSMACLRLVYRFPKKLKIESDCILILRCDTINCLICYGLAVSNDFKEGLQ